MSVKHKCTTASHQTKKPSEVRRLRPWTEADLLIGECADCGSTLSWPLSWPAPKKKNPAFGTQRDLLGEYAYPRDMGASQFPAAFAERGETPVFRALSDLTEDEIVSLPRKAFTDAEWAELGKNEREAIYDGDEESSQLINNFVGEFVKRYKWAISPDHLDYANVEEYFEEHLRELAAGANGGLIAHADRAGYDASEWIEEQVGLGYSEEQAREALEEALSDSNLYEFTYDAAEYGRAFFKDLVTESLWMDSTDVADLIEEKGGKSPHRAMFRDEIERACKLVEEETNRIGDGMNLDIDDIVRKDGYVREVNIDDVATWWVDADPDWDKVTESALEKLSESDPLGPLVGEAPPEERVLYRWKDGFYVQDLTPQELPAEGKKMGMCVGRPDMGYGKAVRDGEIKILSLRRPSGKPLFTFEVNLDGDEITGVQQIKGNANRLPGFDLGRSDPKSYPVKKDEVGRVIEFLTQADGFDLIDINEIDDLNPALHAIALDTTAWGDQMRSLISRVSDAPDDTVWTKVEKNPAPACRAGDAGHDQCTGFCAPYRRRR